VLRFAFDKALERKIIHRPVELVVEEAIGLPRLEAKNSIDGYRRLVDAGCRDDQPAHHRQLIARIDQQLACRPSPDRHRSLLGDTAQPRQRRRARSG
jgi:hypothetical protein